MSWDSWATHICTQTLPPRISDLWPKESELRRFIGTVVRWAGGGGLTGIYTYDDS